MRQRIEQCPRIRVLSMEYIRGSVTNEPMNAFRGVEADGSWIQLCRPCTLQKIISQWQTLHVSVDRCIRNRLEGSAAVSLVPRGTVVKTKSGFPWLTHSKRGEEEEWMPDRRFSKADHAASWYLTLWHYRDLLPCPATDRGCAGSTLILPHLLDFHCLHACVSCHQRPSRGSRRCCIANSR